jgi:hypothetical protein
MEVLGSLPKSRTTAADASTLVVGNGETVMKQITIAAVVALVGAIMLPAAHGQPMHSHGAGDKSDSAKAAYSPGLGEIMSLQQMRHSKLWFAGNARNWALAGYELDELKEGFDDAAKLFPMINDVSIAQAISAITSVQLPELGNSISARDRAKFSSAFDKLTATCNACHQTTNHGFIVIQRPTALPYTNQSFTPAPQGPSGGGHQR